MYPMKSTIQCKNGPSCRFHKQSKCRYRHKETQSDSNYHHELTTDANSLLVRNVNHLNSNLLTTPSQVLKKKKKMKKNVSESKFIKQEIYISFRDGRITKMGLKMLEERRDPVIREAERFTAEKIAAEKEAIRIAAEEEANKIAAKKEAERIAAQRKEREIREAQAARKYQLARKRSLSLAINGQTVQIMSIPQTKINVLSENLWCFQNSQHFLYYNGCQIDDCAICLDSNTEGTMMTHLFCRHVFHTQCLEDWLKMKYCCPLCKQDFRKHQEFKFIIKRQMQKQQKELDERHQNEMRVRLNERLYFGLLKYLGKQKFEEAFRTSERKQQLCQTELLRLIRIYRQFL